MSEAKDAESKLKNFRKVTTDLYRGSQPSGKDFDVLKNLGIKTVVTLRWKKKLIEVERKECELRDLKLVSIPLNYTNPPKLKDINSFLEVIDSENNGSVEI